MSCIFSKTEELSSLRIRNTIYYSLELVGIVRVNAPLNLYCSNDCSYGEYDSDCFKYYLFHFVIQLMIEQLVSLIANTT